MLANILHLVLVADWCESSPVQWLRLRQQQQPATHSQLKCLCWPRGPVRRCHIPAPRPILSGAFIKDEMQPIDLRGHFGHTNEQLTCVSAHEMNNAWKLVAHVVPLWARRWPAHGHTQEVIRLREEEQQRVVQPTWLHQQEKGAGRKTQSCITTVVMVGAVCVQAFGEGGGVLASSDMNMHGKHPWTWCNNGQSAGKPRLERMFHGSRLAIENNQDGNKHLHFNIKCMD